MAALAAACGASNLIYKTGRGRTEEDYLVDHEEWKMNVYWSKYQSESSTYEMVCSAVMISDRVGLTAAHCIMSRYNYDITENPHLFKVWFHD